MEISQSALLYGEMTARIRKMLEPVAHDSFLFYEDTIAMLRPYIRSGEKLLDAGCGRGTISAWIAAQGLHVVAIDHSSERLSQLRHLVDEKNLDIDVEVSLLPEQFPEDHFDVILDCFSWWHISDWGRLLNLCKKNLKSHGRLIILDTFFGWKSTVDFRQQMLERWQTAFPTLNECRNMLIKREFRLLQADSIQDRYVRYLEAIYKKIEELEKEDLGTLDPAELKNVKSMWDWFRNAGHKEELSATMIVAELT